MTNLRLSSRSHTSIPVIIAAISIALGCSDDPSGGDNGTPEDNEGGSTSTGTQPKGGQGGSGTTGTSTSTSTSAGTSPTSTATGGALPNGGVEYKGIVNLVDAQGAADLDAYIGTMGRYTGSPTQRLDRLVKVFYEQYEDEYDFVVFFTDHNVATGPNGVFSEVNRPPMIGTGTLPRSEKPDVAPPNLKGTIAIELDTLDRMPPLAHEILHFWANDLDPSFGFGRDQTTNYGAHWGISSVDGQLGGFDGSTLYCETPAGQLPPNCTASADGKIRYIVDWFAPNTYVTPGKPYAPLELYLMGLIPATDVKDPLQIVKGVTYDVDNPEFVSASGLGVVLTGTGVSQVTIADIIAYHGERKLVPTNERNLRVAFVLMTKAPASQTYLSHVASVASVFSGETKSTKDGWISYSDFTGGRGTLTYRLGKRVDPSLPRTPWESPIYVECNGSKQDCPGSLACYGTNNLFCYHPGTLKEGEACVKQTDCEKGLTCAWVPGSTNNYLCAPFCDPNNAAATNACTTLCPTASYEVYAPDGTTIVDAYCAGGSGGTCDPVAQDCADGKACMGTNVTACQIPGSLAKGQTCIYTIDCAKGTTCVGIQGSSTSTCESYCDVSSTAPATTACTSVCTNGRFWTLDNGAGLCRPAT